MLGTLNFTGSKHWAPFNFLRAHPCLMFWKDISSVLRGQFCPKCLLNHTNRLPFFVQFFLRVFVYEYLTLINISCSFKVFWTSILVEQGRALAEPGGPRCLTFVLGWLENLTFFIEITRWAHWISQVQSTGLPSSKIGIIQTKSGWLDSLWN